MDKYYYLVKYPGCRWQVKQLTRREWEFTRRDGAEVSTNGYTSRRTPDKICKRRNESRYLMD